MRAKQAGKVLGELADLAITAASRHLQAANASPAEEDAFWASLCDDKWAFPGAGPPDPDTDRQRTEMLVCDYTLVWYEIDKNKIRTRIRRALTDLLDPY